MLCSARVRRGLLELPSIKVSLIVACREQTGRGITPACMRRQPRLRDSSVKSDRLQDQFQTGIDMRLDLAGLDRVLARENLIFRGQHDRQ